MNDKLIDAIVQLAQQGGAVALWIYGIHVIGSIVKLVIGFGFILAGLYKLSSTIKYCVEYIYGK